MNQDINYCVRATMQRIAISCRERCARVIAVEDCEPSAGAEHAQRFRQRLDRFRNVTQGRVKEHRIEASILVAEGAAITLAKRKVSELSSQFSCLRNEYWRGVDT